jgi:hypothetical protein
MTFCLSAAAILSVTRGIEYILSLVAERVSYLNDSVGWQSSARALRRNVSV